MAKQKKIGEINLGRIQSCFPWVKNKGVYVSETIREKIKGKHPYVSRYWGKLSSTLERPDRICKDKDYPNRTVYYKDYEKLLEGKAKFLKAVIESRDEGNMLITFHPVRKFHPKEVSIWQKR